MIMIPSSTATATAQESLRFKTLRIRECKHVLTTLNASDYSTESLNHACNGFKLIKDDRGEPLTIVSETYDLLQPTLAFAFLDCLKDEIGFTYENAGFTTKGANFIQGSLGEFEVPTSNDRKGDILDKRIVARTSFDGSLATVIQIELLRVWCSNGWASWDKENKIAKVKHTRIKGFNGNRP